MSHIHKQSAAPTFDDSDSGEEAPAPKANAKPYKPTRRQALVSHTTSSTEQKEIKVIEKSPEATEKIRQITNTNFLFSLLDASQKETIIGAMFPVQHQVGDVIIRQGDQGDNFYVIDSGEVDVLITPKPTSPTDQPKQIKVAHMLPGQGFGEIALLHNCPRTATIVATTPCNLWAIDQVTYRQVMRQTVLEKRRRYTDLISHVPFFSKLTPYQRSSVCDAVSEETYPPQTDIVKQGDIGDKFYIIEDGKCDVFIQSANSAAPEKVGEMSPPQFFGEIALLSADAKRAATVRTQDKCTILVLDKQSFVRLLGPIEGELRENILHYTKPKKEQAPSAAPKPADTKKAAAPKQTAPSKAPASKPTVTPKTTSAASKPVTKATAKAASTKTAAPKATTAAKPVATAKPKPKPK